MLIGEVADASGISRRMLRHYDRIGVVQPTGRGANGYREYSPADMQRLFHVEALRSLGLTLQEAGEVLEGQAFAPGAVVEELIARTRERLSQEQELLRRLERVHAAEPAEWEDVLSTVRLLRGLEASDASARQRLALSLTEVDSGAVEPIAEAFLSEEEPNALGALQWALARHDDVAVPVLAQALSSEDAGRRRRAVEALEKLGSAMALEALADAASSKDAHVQRRATIALGRLGDAESVPALVALVAAGEDDVEASDVLESLANEGGYAREVADELGLTVADAAPDARRRLAAAFAGLPKDDVRDQVIALASDPDAGVAATAAYILGTLVYEK